jgi:hypothetical protein
VNSVPYTVPKTAVAVTFHVPALAGTNTSLKVQTLFPAASDQDPEVWGDTSGFNTTNGTTQAASPIWEGFVTTMPIAFLGGGVQRLVASADQSGAPTTIGLIFHMGGG